MTEAIDTTNTTAPGVGEAQAVPLEPVTLTIVDLQLLARIVDLASRRGAFQANELTQVGEAFDKLAGFLAYVDSQSKETAEPEEVAAAE